MSEENQQNLTDILDGNVAEVAASLEGLSEEELLALLEAEQAGKTRVGVVSEIQALLEPSTDDTATVERTADDVQAEIDDIESRAIDIKGAERLHALRDELAGLK